MKKNLFKEISILLCCLTFLLFVVDITTGVTDETGIGRPGYRVSPMSPETKVFYDSIQRKIANGESLSWSDKHIIRELQIIRQWPVLPQPIDEQKKFIDYINGLERPLTFTEILLVRHFVNQGLWPDGKDILPPGTEKEFIDYYNNLSPEKLCGVSQLKKAWMSARGTTDSPQQRNNLAKEALILNKEPQRESIKEQTKGQQHKDINEKLNLEMETMPISQKLNQKVEENKNLESVTDTDLKMVSSKGWDQDLQWGKQDTITKMVPDTREQVIQLVVSGVQELWQVAAVKQILREQVKGVKEVIQQSFASGTAVFDVHMNGDAQRLAEELTLSNPGHFKLKVLGITPNKLNMKLVESGS